MRHLLILCLCCTTVVASRAATKGIEPPVLLTKIEPDATPPPSDVLIEPTMVKLTVDSDGAPFAVESAEGLPDSVVNTLTRLRFKPGTKDGRRAAFAVALTMPVRRPLTPLVERSFAPTWVPSGLLIEIFDLAKQWDPKEIKKRADRLSSAPEQQEMIHGTALLHALFTGTPEQVHEARVDHLLWVIRNAPRLEILRTPAALIGQGQEPFADPALKQEAEEEWLKQIAASPDDFEVLDHALNFLQFADSRKAAALARDTKGWPKADLWVGREYGLRGVGVTGLDPRSGVPLVHEEKLPETPFEVAIRSALLQSKNTQSVLSALTAVSLTKHFLAAAGPLPSGYEEFCGELLRHAKDLYPNTSLSCDPSELAEQENALSSINRGVVRPAKLIKNAAPVYPAEAKHRRIEGTVILSAMIDRQGNVQTLELLSGPLALYRSARDAVQHWRYMPVTLNGEPIEAQTAVTVNYALQ